MTQVNKRRRIIKCLLLGLLLSLLLGTGAQASWKKTAKGTRYYVSGQKYVTGFKRIKGSWYYFNKKGYLQKSGFTRIGGKRYFLHKKTGVRMTDCWFRVGKYYYYADEDGVMQKNRWIGNYYVKSNYRRAFGWLELDGERYYLNPGTGKKTVGLKTIDGKKYYFDKTGVMEKNKWIKVKKKYYYLQEDGSAATDTWVGEYRVGADGARTGETLQPGLVTTDGKTYYLGESLEKISGWIQADESTYYFGGEDAAALTGLQEIDGSTYYFDENGAMQTGWQEIDKITYYFDELGIMVKNNSLLIDGVSCTFGEDGACLDSGLGFRIAQYALRFEGSPYVYGGNNLLTGVDCSGFTSQIMKHFKILIPRTADDQRKGKDSCGTYTASVEIKPKLSALLPGDLLFYGTAKPAYAGHVALYIGNGKVIHASTESTGVIISDYNYQKPIAARRYWL